MLQIVDRYCYVCAHVCSVRIVLRVAESVRNAVVRNTLLNYRKCCRYMSSAVVKDNIRICWCISR
jgi:hypothetical protein